MPLEFDDPHLGQRCELAFVAQKAKDKESEEEQSPAEEARMPFLNAEGSFLHIFAKILSGVLFPPQLSFCFLVAFSSHEVP